jgi:methylmalonyl-CoA/ethylmalonyl-CoA epimerase
VDHVGLAVADLDAAAAFHSARFDLEVIHREDNPEQGVAEAMLAPRGAARYDGTQIQLIAPLGADSPLSRFLTRSGPAMHHLAYRVGSIDLATQLLTDRGVRLLYDAARSGTRGSRINFVHPRDAGGVLVELVEVARSG